jgi:uncharacterized MAPEG superfamily protein
MTVSHWCLLAAALLPYACTAIAKGTSFGRRRADGGYDNHDPRAWLARQSGRAGRAHAAQLNSFEGLPFFIGAVLMAHQLHAPQARLDALSVGFIACRVAYIALYVSDRATLRTVVWTAGMAVNLALFLAALG